MLEGTPGGAEKPAELLAFLHRELLQPDLKLKVLG
jgi:hypothetical protein